MSNPIAIPDIGIYPGMPAEDYHALPLCSAHALSVIADQSPMHLKYQRENPKPPTDALVVGSALHTLVLEPEKAEAEIKIGQDCSAVLKSGPNKGNRCGGSGVAVMDGQWFCGRHAPAGATQPTGILTAGQYEQVSRMRDAVLNHRAARELLADSGQNELSVIWDIPIRFDDVTYPLRNKMRTDIVRPTWGAVADLKSCDSASREEFERSIATFGYHRQAANYLDGLNDRGFNLSAFVFICVEKIAPYGVAVYRLTSDAIDLGREELKKLRQIYATCERFNHWWGYELEFQDVSLPTWKFRQLAKAV